MKPLTEPFTFALGFISLYDCEYHLRSPRNPDELLKGLKDEIFFLFFLGTNLEVGSPPNVKKMAEKNI